MSGDFSCNPSWGNLTVRLYERFNSDYKGVVLFGSCPNCKHDDGINMFIPTTWAAITGPGHPAVAYISATAYLEAAAPGAGPDAGGREIEALACDTPDPRLGVGKEEEIVEVIVCRCGKEHDHQPPSGRYGCGYWAYLHLPKATIPNGQ
jgi:hypothetical protein